VIHICGALKHRYVDGDRRYFSRMLGRATDTAE
jgi:cytochrome b561